MYFSTVIRLSLFLQFICETRIQTWNQMSVFWFSILTNDQQSFKCSLILKHCDDSSFPAYHEPIRVITSSQFACELNWLELCNGIYCGGQGSKSDPFLPKFFSGFLLLVMFSTEMIFSTFIIFLSRS